MRDSSDKYKKTVDYLPCQSVQIFGHLWSSREKCSLVVYGK